MRTQSVFRICGKFGVMKGPVLCLIVAAAFLSGCSMNGAGSQTAEVAIHVTVPDMTVLPAESRAVSRALRSTDFAAGTSATSESRLFNPDTHTVLVVVVTPGFDGGRYSLEDSSGGPSLSYIEDFFLDAEEGRWSSISMEGTTFGFAFLMIPLLPGNVEAAGTITGMPVGADLIFMVANSDQHDTDIGNSFAEIMAEINSDASTAPAPVLCRGYRVQTLTAGENEVFVPLIPTKANVTGSTDFDLVVTSGGGTLNGYVMEGDWNLYTCTGISGQAYLLELTADDAGFGDIATLYMFDSRGQTIGVNPRPGNRIEITFGGFSVMTMPWDDIESSQFYIAVFGHTDGNGSDIPFTKTITER